MSNVKLLAKGYILTFAGIFLLGTLITAWPAISAKLYDKPLELSDTDTAYQAAVVNATMGLSGTQSTIFAGFALVAVGIIVLFAFGLISVFGGA